MRPNTRPSAPFPNLHVAAFEHDGCTWKSIEHVFQAKKIAIANPEVARRFTVESGDALGLGDGLAARAARKVVKLDKAQLARWDAIKDDVMRRAARSKYAQCEEARVALLATNEAELWHVMPRQTPVRFTHLEDIRAELRANDS